jgi:hypothetical protein
MNDGEINGALAPPKGAYAPYQNMKDGGAGGMNDGEINGALAPPKGAYAPYKNMKDQWRVSGNRAGPVKCAGAWLRAAIRPASSRRNAAGKFAPATR